MIFVLHGLGVVELIFDDGARATTNVASLRAVVQTADMVAEAADADEGFMDVRDVAHHTGAPLSTVRYWCQTGALRASKVGRRWAVRPSDLDAFIGGGRA